MAVEISSRSSARCFFVAWIFGWVAAIFVPSGLLVLLNVAPVAEGASSLTGILAVADEVAPAAKIGFAVIFAALALGARWMLTGKSHFTVITDMVFGAIAMLTILAVLPLGWSRGFGIGLAGERFAPAETIIYVAGGFVSGLVFSLSELKCRSARRMPKA